MEGGPVFEAPVRQPAADVFPELAGSEFYNNAYAVVVTLNAIRTLSEREKSLQLLVHTIAILPWNLIFEISPETIHTLADLLLSQVDGNFNNFVIQADIDLVRTHYLIIEHLWFTIDDYIMEYGPNETLEQIKDLVYLLAQLRG